MAMRISQVHEAVHSGIRNSSRKYANWSDGWTLTDSGVEGLMVAEIAACVNKEQSKDESLLLEVPYNTCQKWSGARPKGRKLATFKGRRRADIVLFNGNGQTKYIIEVKRTLSKAGLQKDLEKLSHAMAKCAKQQNGKLKRTFLAVFATSETRYLSAKKWTQRFFDHGDSAGAKLRDFTHKTWRERGTSVYSMCIEIGY